jgi:hypothetical protein
MTSEKPFFIERQTVRMDGKNVTASGDGDYVIKASGGIPIESNRAHSQYMRDINSARYCDESNLSLRLNLTRKITALKHYLPMVELGR